MRALLNKVNIKMDRKILVRFGFVILGVFLFRLGSHIPLPGVNPQAINNMFSQNGTLMDLFNAFSGGALKRLSIFSIGIMPYISASIILFLAGFFVPHVKALKESGIKGQITINQYTRILTVFISFFQAIAFVRTLMVENALSGNKLIPDTQGLFIVMAICTLMAGSFAIIWISDKITEFGIGNGTSIMIYASILSSLPQAILGTYELAKSGDLSIGNLMVVLLIIVIAYLMVVSIELAQRRISIINSNQVNTKIKTKKSFIPFKLNMSGVLPPVLASTIIMFPLTIVTWFENRDSEISQWVQSFFQHGSLSYIIMFSLLIFGISFAFNKLQNNPKAIAERLKNSGVFIEGFRPGEQTEKILSKVLIRLTFIGAVFLLIICLLPELLSYKFSVPFYFGGTSLIIIVTVGLEFSKSFKREKREFHYKNIKNEIKSLFNNENTNK